MTQDSTIYLSPIAKRLVPYTFHLGKPSDKKFNANTPPTPPPSLARFLSDMQKECPINEYPDPTYQSLREKIAQYESVSFDQITITNSGDEAIDIVAKATLTDDAPLITAPPTFELFSEVSEINRGTHIPVPLVPETFQIDTDRLIHVAKEKNPRLIFLCNPNNPTGSVSPEKDIRKIVESVSCIVVVDEVYREYYGQTMTPYINTYPNLVVLRSFSKFAAIAGCRVGYLLANEQLSKTFSAIRFPMGVSYFSARLAEYVLTYDQAWIKENVSKIIKERRRMSDTFTQMGYRVYPSEANFLLVRIGDRVNEVCQTLEARGILIRNRSSNPYLPGCARISIRSKKENDMLIQAMQEISS